jgi:arylsulfatase A-like enzyme
MKSSPVLAFARRRRSKVRRIIRMMGDVPRRCFAFVLAILSMILLARCSPDRASESRPNILFIMADDHALRAISAFGSDLIDTPNIDRIAKEGVLFENSFVTNSICAPSRAVLLTGKYSHRNGLRDNRDEFDGSQETFPKLLQRVGYQTAMIGKWHLKTDPTGFDDWRILIGQGQYYNPVFNENGTEVERKGYVTDLITDLAIDFLDRRDKTKPFALLYHHKAPHRNWMPAERHLDAFEGRDFPLPETFYDDYAGRAAAKAQDMRVADMWFSVDMKLHPEYFGEETGSGGNASFDPTEEWSDDYGRLDDEQRAAWDAHYRPINEAFRDDPPAKDALAEWKYQRYLEDYLGTVAAVDENVGRMLDYLDENGLAENTIVIYTSDQGFYLGEHGWYDKRFMYEESLRMPLVMRYPARVGAGKRVDELVLNLDFAPSLLDFAGVTVPHAMQGRSLLPLVASDATGPSDWRDAIYYRYYEFPHGWHNVRPHYGVRTDRYKLIHFEADLDVWELYDLESDPHELRNLYGNEDYQKVQEELRAKLSELQHEVGDLP